LGHGAAHEADIVKIVIFDTADRTGRYRRLIGRWQSEEAIQARPDRRVVIEAASANRRPLERERQHHDRRSIFRPCPLSPLAIGHHRK
jgi:hypothetical protein